MNDLFYDITHAWRNLCAQPGTSLLIIVTLALGIGVNTAMFSMTWHVLLAPLPYDDGDRLVKLEQHETARQLDDTPWSMPTIADLREQNTVFSSVLQYFEMRYILYSGNGSFLASTGIVDGNFFSVLGLEPVLGRILTPDDDRPGAAPAMLLTDQFWMEAFGGNPDVIGSTVEMSGLVYTVVGVLPALPPYPGANDIWIPAANDWAMSDPGIVNDRSSRGLLSPVIAKLKDGVSLDQARQDLALFSERLASSYPDIYRAESGYTITLRPLKEAIAGSSARTLTLLMSLAFLVALIASTNFANITLARMMRRSQELAVREAVGADPGRLKRQLFTENILIAIIGGLVGLLLAALGLGFLADFAAIYTPFSNEINLDGRVLWFCFAVSLASGVLSAVVASSHTRDINQALKEGGDKVTASIGAKKLKDVLLAVQCALAFVMLTSTALMASSLYGLVSQPTGYDTEGVVALSTIMRGVGSATVREIGMHMAIGANPANVMSMFISQGLKIYLFGLLLGIALMITAAPLIEPLLYETSAMDFRLYLASSLLLTVAVLLAMYLPARKASVMLPAEVLRCE